VIIIDITCCLSTVAIIYGLGYQFIAITNED